jgi:DNA ligase D-like protein (predicted 3'-phosphoesterase)
MSDYRRNRRSGPRGRLGRRRRARSSEPRYVIAHHPVRSEHYDLRLEIQGVLVSWVIAEGPSTNPRDRRMARRAEDHPLDHVVPEDEAPIWDRGSYANATEHEMAECLDRGHLSFRLQGEKLNGGFTLTRIRTGEDETWLLIKRNDEVVDPRRKPVTSQPEPPMYSDATDEAGHA